MKDTHPSLAQADTDHARINTHEGSGLAVGADLAASADSAAAAVVSPPETDSERLLSTLDADDDPFGILEATAAIAGGPGGEEGGGSFVRLDRILEPTTPLGLDYPRPGRIQEELPRLSGTRTSADAAGATPLNLFIQDDNGSNTRMGGPGNDIILGDRGGIETKFVSGKSYNLNLLVDMSTSMQWDWNGNPTGNPSISRLETTKTALKSFLTNHVATHQGGDINVKLTWYPDNSSNVDIPEVIGLGINHQDGLQDLLDAIDNLTADGSGTPYGQAFDKARTWFEQMATNSAYDNHENVTMFLTDSEPNYYNGAANSADWEHDLTRQTAFEALEAISPTIYAIGLGSDMNQFTLDRYDTTTPTGVSAPDRSNIALITDGAGDQVTKKTANWSVVGANTGNVNFWAKAAHSATCIDLADGSGAANTTIRQNYYITITDAAYPGGAYPYLGFDFESMNSWTEADGSQFVWRLLKWNSSSNDWDVVESGIPVVSHHGYFSEGSVYARPQEEGYYTFEFEFTRGATQTGDIDVKVKYIHIAGLHPNLDMGQGHQVADPDDLGVTLVSNHSSTVPIALGDDVLTGGDGDDIIFGDAPYTGNLPWADVGGMPAGYNKTGLDALDDFLVLKLGLASVADLTDADRYDYIKANHALLHSSTDMIGGHDTLHGGAGNDILYGQGGDDTLYGGAGDDVLYGDMGNDTLYGDEGDDTLLGGAGDDILFGGAGDDTFLWLDGDAGSVSNPAKDVIKDFGTGNDKLDLRDLLQGEESSGDLSQYLNFSLVGNDTVIQVSTIGDLSGTGMDQEITLEGMDLLEGETNQNTIINDLLTQGKLLLDT